MADGKVTVCVLGGTGFVGKRLILRLAKAGFGVRVASRNKRRNMEINNYPQTTMVEADAFNKESLQEACKGSEVLINLIGVLNNGKGNSSYQRAHVEIARNITKVTKDEKISRIIQISALNADPGQASSGYLQSKGEAESLLKVQSSPKANITVFRPSVIFGHNGGFVMLFSNILKKFRFLPLACAESKVAPVYVEDVVEALVLSIDDEETYGKIYDLCGDKTHSMQEIVEIINSAQGSNSRVVPLGNSLSRLFARIFGILPGKNFTMDNYESLQHDAECSKFPDFMGEYKFTPFVRWAKETLGSKAFRQNYNRYRKEAQRK